MNNTRLNHLYVATVLAVTFTSLSLLTVGCSSVSQTIIKNDILTEKDSLQQKIAFDHYLTGSIHEEAGELHQAAVEYNLALLYDSQSSAVATSVARIYGMLGHREAAIIVLEASRISNPADEEILRDLSELYIRSGNLGKAVDVFDSLRSIRPLSEREMTVLTAMLTQMLRLDDVLELCRESIERFGPSRQIYDRISRIHFARMNMEAADTALQRLVEMDSTDHAAWFDRGRVAVSGEKWEEAEKYFNRSLSLDSSNIMYWSNMLLALSEQRKDEKVIELTGLASERFDNIPQFYDIRGTAFERLNRLDEALTALETSISIDSNRISPYLTKGFVHHLREEWDQGAESYEKALSIEPGNALVLNNYAYLLAVQNHRLGDALEMVEKALAARPETPSFLDTRGWIFYLQDQPGKALIDLQNALTKEPDNAELHEHLGYIYKALGKNSKAKNAWRRAAELDPDNIEYSRLAD